MNIKFPFQCMSQDLNNEIAEKMGLPLGTVKSRIFFARQRLQEILKDYK